MINLARVRALELDMNQATFALECHETIKFISKIEKGEIRMTVNVAMTLDRLSKGQYSWHDWFKNSGGKGKFAIAEVKKKLSRKYE